jgi:hypothetical protein
MHRVPFALALALALAASTPAAAAVAPTVFTPPSTVSALGVDARLARAQELMALAGVSDLAEAGTIDLTTTRLTPGAFFLQASSCGVGGFPGPSAPPPSGGTTTCTAIPGWFDVAPLGIGLLGMGGAGTVTQITGESLSDVAVIIADHVIFDDALLTLSTNVRELWIIARTVENASSTVTWERAGLRAASLASLSSAAIGSPSYNPTAVTSASAFDSPNGGAGSSGRAGTQGNAGRAAPDVYVVVQDVLPGSDGVENLPIFDLRGEGGGAGQNGQAGGRGGHGAKGADAISNAVNCVQGAGWGGDGGRGGSGGRGGNGGGGGAGGDVTLWYVDGLAPIVSSSRGGGAAGAGGTGGAAASGGTGGQAGDPKGLWCFAEPTRAGSNGAAGTAGSRGTAGVAGAAGVLDVDTISYGAWEALFTEPWLVSADDPEVEVGQEIVFETANVTGGAFLVLLDVLDGSSRVVALDELGGGLYALPATVTATMDAGVYDVELMRATDSVYAENLYQIELFPVLDEVVFADAFDALPRGTAIVRGLGLREEIGLLWDGAPMTVTGITHGATMDEATVTVPAIASDSAGLFLRDDGRTLHDVELDAPWPLAPATALVQTTLLRHDGLTFLPSEDAYAFTNGRMTDEVKAVLHDRMWTAFEETYGAAEVDAAMTLNPIVTGLHYGLYAAWWADGIPSADCLGMSSHVLQDFFLGVSGVASYAPADVAWNVGITQGKLLSSDVLGTLVGESSASTFSDVLTVDTIAAFFAGADATDADAMPVIVMAPDVHALTESLVNVMLPADLEPSDTQFNELNTSIGGSHALAPYLAVYADVSDARPTRIYVYDSNAAGTTDDPEHGPAWDGLFLTVDDSGLGITFDYHPLDDDYQYASAGGWTLGQVPVGMMMGDVDLLTRGWLY